MKGVIAVIAMGLCLVILVGALVHFSNLEYERMIENTKIEQTITDSERFKIDRFESFYMITDIETGAQYITKYDTDCPFTSLNVGGMESGVRD